MKELDPALKFFVLDILLIVLMILAYHACY